MSKKFDAILRTFLKEITTADQAGMAAQPAIDRFTAATKGSQASQVVPALVNAIQTGEQKANPNLSDPVALVQALANPNNPYEKLDPAHAKDKAVVDHLKTLGLQPYTETSTTTTPTPSTPQATNQPTNSIPAGNL